MPEEAQVAQSLNPGAQRIVEGAHQRQQEGKHPQLGANHWLLELIMRHGAMAEDLARGLEAVSLQKYLRDQLREGKVGPPLDSDTAITQAVLRARARGKEQATERDLAAVILAAASYDLVDPGPISPPQTTSTTSQSDPSTGEQDPIQNPKSKIQNQYAPRARRPTPTLEQYGRDMTRQAAEGKLPPVIGREQEVELITETLCRRTKRNPVLVGPAGVGKTAVIEGLAQRIVEGHVPDELKNVRLIGLQPSTLVAGASVVGELEKRMKAILTEASQDGILLFIDELHSMVGAGGSPGSSDIASLLKPALARGDLACIAATTDDEYRRFIEPDAALERRFQPVRVQELTPEQTLQVLLTLRDDLAKVRQVHVPDEVLSSLVEFAQNFMRNRHFPDKAVDLLEQCVAYAVTHGKDVVELSDARAVVERMVGMPLDLGDRLASLREKLSDRGLLTPADVESLLNRLEVTMRGLDMRLSRPNAIVLLIGDAAQADEALSEMLAEELFGSKDRVVAIDFSRFVHPADVTSLIGAPPGYVGYSDSLPLHRVAQMPWCVLRCENIDACHPAVLAVMTQALSDGFVSQATGKNIYLSDTVVLLTAHLDAGSTRPIGFRRGEGEATSKLHDVQPGIAGALGEELASQIDLVCSDVPRSGDAGRHHLEKYLLPDLSERYSKRGLSLHWDESLIQWLLEQRAAHTNSRDWERLVDERLSPLLVKYLPTPSQKEATSLTVKYEGDQIRIDPNKPDKSNEGENA
jgi:ATP-dependent Clp protease ATP-binding subunit ClpC